MSLKVFDLVTCYDAHQNLNCSEMRATCEIMAFLDQDPGEKAPLEAMFERFW